MSLLSTLPSPFARSPHLTVAHTTIRLASTTPTYGRTHVWKRRARKLPNPFVPVFPQRLVRVDGSTIVHHTSSPRAALRLTRDTTNHPVWNALRFVGQDAEEDEETGRLGRFSRKFAELGMGGGQRPDLSWMEDAAAAGGVSAGELAREEKQKKGKGKKGR
ncbi:uncharacterized protein BXZ73DRAFT_43299 [Epithele typhae]|uniref:uncharacterized protein n=1 Tax=Epithele typhae TaxID=378194 RepID=UPI0020082413|nr:uncharacterized protein BXZ73DRAFT_43299 [Epithele typhae]KAH9940222.1 hypothetical protein BXZ73DRAFT_43299 [Epithele typhae]